jgi:hypothetical protein
VTNCPLAWWVAQRLPLIKRTGRVVAPEEMKYTNSRI